MVVVAHDGGPLLERQLDALRDQTIAPERYEVVVAQVDARGEVFARNEGWRRARAPRVAFTTDVCRALPGWLEALLAASAGEPAIVHGPTSPFADKLRSRRPLYDWVDRPLPDFWFPATNVLYPRHVLEQLGGFDETFRGGEAADADLAARATGLGIGASWVQNAVMPHDVVLAPGRKLRRAARAGELALLLRRHPGLRSQLPRRVFSRADHEWLVRAGVALVVPGRHRWLRWWLAAPYAARLAGARTLRISWPFQLLCDLVEFATLAAGAVRHRVLVL